MGAKMRPIDIIFFDLILYIQPCSNLRFVSALHKLEMVGVIRGS